MEVYLDTSALLRVVLNEPRQLAEFDEITYAVSSELLKVEGMRTIDRIRILHDFDDGEVAAHFQRLHFALQRVELLSVSAVVIERASQPFPTSLGTLDALHLTSLLLWQEEEEKALTLLTHDAQLSRAARAMGVTVFGC